MYNLKENPFIVGNENIIMKLKLDNAIAFLGEKWALHENNKVKKIENPFKENICLVLKTV